MLVIEQQNKNKKIIQTWHIGGTLPIISRPIVTFQADGHELEIILDALKNHSWKEK